MGWWGVKLLGRKEVERKLGGEPSGQGTGGERGEQGEPRGEREIKEDGKGERRRGKGE